MVKPLPRLLASPPYVKKVLPRWLTGVEPDSLDIPEEHLPLMFSLTAFLLDWLRDRGAIEYVISDSQTFRIKLKEAGLRGGATADLFNQNMRRLAYKEDLERYIRNHTDNDVRHIFTDLQTLMCTMYMQFPETLIEVLINKTYASLNSLPLPGADYTWDTVHRMFPHLWIPIFLQSVLYRYGDFRAVKQ